MVLLIPKTGTIQNLMAFKKQTTDKLYIYIGFGLELLTWFYLMGFCLPWDPTCRTIFFWNSPFAYDKIPSGVNSKSRKTRGRYCSIVVTPTRTGLMSLNIVLPGGSVRAQSRRALPGNDSFMTPELRQVWEYINIIMTAHIQKNCSQIL